MTSWGRRLKREQRRQAKRKPYKFPVGALCTCKLTLSCTQELVKPWEVYRVHRSIPEGQPFLIVDCFEYMAYHIVQLLYEDRVLYWNTCIVAVPWANAELRRMFDDNFERLA